MKLNISSLFNVNTRLAMAEGDAFLAGREADGTGLVKELKERHGLDEIHRFDMGRNTDGYSPLLADVLDYADMAALAAENMTVYPDSHHEKLRAHLAGKFGVGAERIIITTGLENAIDLICRVFLTQGDRYLLPVPNYPLFESYASRTGAAPVYIRMKEEDRYHWTARTLEEYEKALAVFAPKLVWLSNPVNPTGQSIPMDMLAKMTALADERGVLAVVDEAYGEYVDAEAGPVSAASLVDKHDNLVVMRTFSKIYGLPGARIGYAMTSSPEVLKAMWLYRQNFPFSWFSLYAAQIACVDDEFLEATRRKTVSRRMRFMERLAMLPSFQVLPSVINTLMVRSKKLPHGQLWEKLCAKGVLTADLDRLSGLKGQGWIRAAIREDEAAQLLFAALMEIDSEA